MVGVFGVVDLACDLRTGACTLPTFPGTRANHVVRHPGTKAVTFPVNYVNRASHLWSATNGAMPPPKAMAASCSQHAPRPRSGAGGTNERFGHRDHQSIDNAIARRPNCSMSRAPSYRSWAVSSLRRRSQRPSFLIAFAQYSFDRLHDRHLKILLVAAIIHHLAHIFFERLQINHSIVAFGIIVAAEPRSDEPRLTDFVMHELVAVDFRNVDRHLGLGRPRSCKGKDSYQCDADACP